MKSNDCPDIILKKKSLMKIDILENKTLSTLASSFITIS